jgi:uncharacterized membrane protein
MEMSIKTMMIIVIGVIALILLVALFASAGSQSGSMLDGIFSWFKIFGSGA